MVVVQSAYRIRISCFEQKNVECALLNLISQSVLQNVIFIYTVYCAGSIDSQ